MEEVFIESTDTTRYREIQEHNKKVALESSWLLNLFSQEDVKPDEKKEILKEIVVDIRLSRPRVPRKVKIEYRQLTR